MPETKICERCGAVFERKRYRKGPMMRRRWEKKKFCSVACYKLSVVVVRPPPVKKIKKPAAPKPFKSCANPGCSASFKTRGNYCSRDCKRLHRNWRHRHRPKPILPEKTCVRCNASFLPKRSRQVFCEEGCAHRFHNIRTYYRTKHKRKEYLNRTRSRRNAVQKEFNRRNLPMVRARRHEYYMKNKARWLNHKLARRAREKSSPEEMEQCRQWILRVRAETVHICYYCKRRFRGTIHIDHVIPLSKGGRHTVANLCASCPPCNLEKQAKQPDEFTVAGQSFLRL